MSNYDQMIASWGSPTSRNLHYQVEDIDSQSAMAVYISKFSMISFFFFCFSLPVDGHGPLEIDWVFWHFTMGMGWSVKTKISNEKYTMIKVPKATTLKSLGLEKKIKVSHSLRNDIPVLGGNFYLIIMSSSKWKEKRKKFLSGCLLSFGFNIVHLT